MTRDAGTEQSGLSTRFATAEDIRLNRPVYIVWELTQACDQRCGHCGSRAGRPAPRELDTEQCRTVVAELAALGAREVTLIGGEAYLRRDWIEIVRAITDAGMVCTMQSGGRHLSEERVRAARDAGLSGLGISIDGGREVHDRLRGVTGSYDAAMRALRAGATAGLWTGVNTQITPAARADLPALLEALIDAGATVWRLGLVAPMGNAADRPELLFQPYELVELMPALAALDARAKQGRLSMQVDNSLGYFGPYEHLWRGIGVEHLHWTGCAAGRNTMGIEADGTVKACPSLPTVPYAAGNAADNSLSSIWNREGAIAFTRERTRDDLHGFCATCYYADVCRAGCSWMSHVLLGRPGDNPYCHHRTLELARQGYRERVELVEAAGGVPYDYGRFELILEHTDGSHVPATTAAPRDGTCDRDALEHSGAQWDGHTLEICLACKRHVYAGTQICPHCSDDVSERRRAHEAALERARQACDRLVAALHR